MTRATCGVNWFFWKTKQTLNIFLTLEKKFQKLGKNLHQGFCVSTKFSIEILNEPGMHFTCPPEHFEENISAETKTFEPLGNEQEKAGFLAKQFWQSCQNGIPCVQRNTLRQKVFSKKNIILTLFAEFEWRNSRFWQNFSTKVSKLKSKLPVDFFEKCFLGRRCSFKSSCCFSEEKLTFKKTPVFSGRVSRCPVEQSERQFSRRNGTFLIDALWMRIFRVSGKTNLTEFPKLQSMWSEKFLE